MLSSSPFTARAALWLFGGDALAASRRLHMGRSKHSPLTVGVLASVNSTSPAPLQVILQALFSRYVLINRFVFFSPLPAHLHHFLPSPSIPRAEFKSDFDMAVLQKQPRKQKEANLLAYLLAHFSFCWSKVWAWSGRDAKSCKMLSGVSCGSLKIVFDTNAPVLSLSTKEVEHPIVKDSCC